MTIDDNKQLIGQLSMIIETIVSSGCLEDDEIEDLYDNEATITAYIKIAKNRNDSKNLLNSISESNE